MQENPRDFRDDNERPQVRRTMRSKGRRQAAGLTEGRKRAADSKGVSPIWISAVLALLAIGALAGALVMGAGALEKREEAEEMVSARLKIEAERSAMVQRHSPRYGDLIRRYAAEYDLEPAFVAAVIYRESHFDPNAVSSKNARGLMQLMPDTIEWVAPKCGIDAEDPTAVFVPENAIKMGCYLIRYIIGQISSDDPILVACAYHAGWGNVTSWLKKYSPDGKSLKISDIPMSDTREYAERVVESYAIYLQNYYPSGGTVSGAADGPWLPGAGGRV